MPRAVGDESGVESREEGVVTNTRVESRKARAMKREGSFEE